MYKKSTFLGKMADKILKVADQAKSLEASKLRSERLKKLHDAITEKYRFAISHGKDTTELENQIGFIKKLEKTLSPTWSQENILERLLAKYNIQ